MNKLAQIKTLRVSLLTRHRPRTCAGGRRRSSDATGCPLRNSRLLALAEIHAYQEEIEKSRQLIAARKAATDPIIRDALQLAITKVYQEQLLTKIKR